MDGVLLVGYGECCYCYPWAVDDSVVRVCMVGAVCGSGQCPFLSFSLDKHTHAHTLTMHMALTFTHTHHPLIVHVLTLIAGEVGGGVAPSQHPCQGRGDGGRHHLAHA